MNTFESLYDINIVASRILGQQVIFHIGLTADTVVDTICLDEFDIRDTKGVSITSKMANTILHNLACALEDSKHAGTYFTVARSQNDFEVVCKGNRGLQVCLSCIKKEMDRMFDTVKKCKEDIKKIADQFGTETIQHVLNNRRLNAI